MIQKQDGHFQTIKPQKKPAKNINFVSYSMSED